MARANQHRREQLLDAWATAIEEIHASARTRDEAFKRATEAGGELSELHGIKLSAVFDDATAAALQTIRDGSDPGRVEIEWSITPAPIPGIHPQSLKAVG